MLNNTIRNLKSEINEMLLFFVESDIKAYGFITRGTEEAFKQAYWLLDMIASHLRAIKQKDFTSINLEVYHFENGMTKAIFTLDDGNDNVYHRSIIDFTNFPLNEIRFFYTNDILFLPSEY